MTAIKELNKELTDLCARLQDLQERYTDDHPDVMALKDKIDKKQKQIKQAEAELAASAGSRQPKSLPDPVMAEAASISSSTSVTQLESELRANQSEIQNYQKHQNELESQVSAYLARLNMAPAAEQELAAISRGYEESKANYNSLLQKKMQSELATSLEERQKGEQFLILDPPSLPNKHIAPNRFKFSVDGLGLGILLGLAIAAILEVTDIRVREEKDLKAVLPALVLIRIPRLSTPTEEDVDVMARWLDFSAVMIVITLIAIGNFYAFFKR